MSEEDSQFAQQLDLDEAEREFLRTAPTRAIHEIFPKGVLTTFQVTKNLEKMTRQLIDSNSSLESTISANTNQIISSNKALAAASNRQAQSLTWATWALVVATLSLVIVSVLGYWPPSTWSWSRIQSAIEWFGA